MNSTNLKKPKTTLISLGFIAQDIQRDGGSKLAYHSSTAKSLASDDGLQDTYTIRSGCMTAKVF